MNSVAAGAAAIRFNQRIQLGYVPGPGQHYPVPKNSTRTPTPQQKEAEMRKWRAEMERKETLRRMGWRTYGRDFGTICDDLTRGHIYCTPTGVEGFAVQFSFNLTIVAMFGKQAVGSSVVVHHVAAVQGTDPAFFRTLTEHANPVEDGDPGNAIGRLWKRSETHGKKEDELFADLRSILADAHRCNPITALCMYRREVGEARSLLKAKQWEAALEAVKRGIWAFNKVENGNRWWGESADYAEFDRATDKGLLGRTTQLQIALGYECSRADGSLTWALGEVENNKKEILRSTEGRHAAAMILVASHRDEEALRFVPPPSVESMIRMREAWAHRNTVTPLVNAQEHVFVSNAAQHASLCRLRDVAGPPRRWRCTDPNCDRLVWEPDAVGVCYDCQIKVKIFSRHHCRQCGRVCCGACSAKAPCEGALLEKLGFVGEQRQCKRCRLDSLSQLVDYRP